ncbi:MAG: RND transporter, partial [bacterium]|nr:RND transporter [bacterium]
MKILKPVIAVVILAAAAGGILYFFNSEDGAPGKVNYSTQPLGRADLVKSISATGTVEPEELVNVGAQVSGKITVFEKDADGKAVDYGSPVKEGMVLARIDDLVYDAEMRSAEAQKLKANAAILSSKANIELAKAKLVLAKNNWERAQRLYPQHAMAKSDYDNYKAEFDAATATVSVNEAALAEANASLASAIASYDKAKRNLEYCTITSPVDGVIIDRRVSIGQTVVSNMSASS